MKWFLNLPMKAKLSLAFGLIILFLGIVIVSSYRGFTNTRETTRSAIDDLKYAIALKDIRSNQNGIRAAELELLFRTRRIEQGDLLQEIADRAKKVDNAIERVLVLIGDDAELKKRIEELSNIRTEFTRTRDSEVLPLIREGENEEAKKLIFGVQLERNEKMRTIVGTSIDQAEKKAENMVALSNQITEESMRIAEIVGGIAVLVLLLLGFLLTRIIADPLKEISRVAEQIGMGDLSVGIPPNHRMDEVGKLSQTFSTMIRTLKSKAEVARKISNGDLTVTVERQSDRDVLGNAFALMVENLQRKAEVARQISKGDLAVAVELQSEKDVLGNAFALMVENLQSKAGIARQISKGDLTVTVELQSEKDVLGQAYALMVENLRRMTQEIREGINILGSSASEILAATTQVASGASETATAVSETTTTVEEVKQTAQVASQKSKYVSESAQKAANVSQGGRRAVEDMVEGMTRIREQMESIAESITRLSEQSQAIGEIIAAVNDLAEQSNLLAVNAAIEAAKAGEQGKGFAVVAQEVKSLAEQSKQATTQVRAILNDIQKGTSAAVMATEQGSKAVEAGVKQSTEAGESIKLLADSIVEAAQAATQIAASSQQQLVGMDQVASAMENIKQASAQNVASTRQAEEAAKTLHDLGQKLQEIVKLYKLTA